MIKAVFDANVFVTGFAKPSGVSSQLLDKWRDEKFTLAISEPIVAEVDRAWKKPYWRARYSGEQVARALRLLRDYAEFPPILINVQGVAAHKEDDLVLATAVSAHADYLVTGDKQLRRIAQYEDVSILSPREFIVILEQLERASRDT